MYNPNQNKYPGVDRPTGHRARINEPASPEGKPVNPDRIESASHAAALHLISPNGTRSSRLVPDVEHGDLRKEGGSVTPAAPSTHRRINQTMTTNGRIPARSTPESLDEDAEIAPTHTTRVTPDGTVTHTTVVQKTAMVEPAEDQANNGQSLFKELLDKCKGK